MDKTQALDLKVGDKVVVNAGTGAFRMSGEAVVLEKPEREGVTTFIVCEVTTIYEKGPSSFFKVGSQEYFLPVELSLPAPAS